MSFVGIKDPAAAMNFHFNIGSPECDDITDSPCEDIAKAFCMGAGDANNALNNMLYRDDATNQLFMKFQDSGKVCYVRGVFQFQPDLPKIQEHLICRYDTRNLFKDNFPTFPLLRIGRVVDTTISGLHERPVFMARQLFEHKGCEFSKRDHLFGKFADRFHIQDASSLVASADACVLKAEEKLMDPKECLWKFFHPNSKILVGMMSGSMHALGCLKIPHTDTPANLTYCAVRCFIALEPVSDK